MSARVLLRWFHAVKGVTLRQNFALDHLSKMVTVGLDLLVVHGSYRNVQDERLE